MAATLLLRGSKTDWRNQRRHHLTPVRHGGLASGHGGHHLTRTTGSGKWLLCCFTNDCVVLQLPLQQLEASDVLKLAQYDDLGTPQPSPAQPSAVAFVMHCSQPH